MMKPIHGPSSLDHLLGVIVQPHACTHVWGVIPPGTLQCRVCYAILVPKDYASIEELETIAEDKNKKAIDTYDRAMKGVI